MKKDYTLTPPQDQQGTLFVAANESGVSPRVYYITGCALIGAAALCFLLALRDYFPPGVISLPIMGALAAFFTGYHAARSPRRVFVGERDLILYYASHKRVILWTQLRWSTKASSTINQQNFLVIYNTDGRIEVRIPPTFTGFDKMVEEVQARLSATHAGFEFRVPLERNWKQAWFLIGLGLALGTLAIYLLVTDHQDLQNGKRLRAEGVQGEGVITRRYKAPNGIITRIEYEVTGANGTTGTDDVEIEPAEWETLAVGDTVSLIYVPDAPDVSELTTLSVNNPRYKDPRPVKVYGQSIAVLCICLFLIGGGVMVLNGVDIAFDEKTKRFRVKRLGES